ncbi:MAG: AtpZ/AtpI family protein [Elusimicrobia bacterium]|nr:AtpZ/AtpI family protein [Candidatus Liberimonas magnetica]
MEKNKKLNWLVVSSLGIMLVSATVIGFTIGFFLDKFLNTSPYFTLGMFLLGIVSGFWSIIKEVKKLNHGQDI